jgi:hypothetical protein
MNSKMTKIKQVSFALAVMATLVFVSACTIRTPSTETPPPVDSTDNTGIEKTFFEQVATINTTEDVGGKKSNVVKNIVKRRTFVCGWAPISETGVIASAWLTHAAVMTNHCNIEFEITNSALIGRLVNPSFPNGDDPKHRNRWKEAIVIPIDNHYYYERAKDSYGRDTNEMVKNSSRSHYSARPLMDLGLDRLSIQDWDMAMFFDSRDGRITKVDDIEWDKDSGFFAFTASVHNPSWGAEIGARIRFNFKAFEHNKEFKQTPYNTKNSKFLNALHVIGEKREGTQQVWSAAKWDLSKTHDVYLHGFPEEYVPVAEDVVEQWNKTFETIDPNKNNPSKKRPKAFRLNKKPMKHPFDLRYPMMVWVDDKQISEVSPLGIGMAAADVRNGEILWGQITLYGGYLESYVKGYLESSGGGASGFAKSAGAKKAARSSISPNPFETYFHPKALTTFSAAMNEGLRAGGASNVLQASTAQFLLKRNLQNLAAQASGKKRRKRPAC